MHDSHGKPFHTIEKGVYWQSDIGRDVQYNGNTGE